MNKWGTKTKKRKLVSFKEEKKADGKKQKKGGGGGALSSCHFSLQDLVEKHMQINSWECWGGCLSEDLTQKTKQIEERVRVEAGRSRRKMRGDQKV